MKRYFIDPFVEKNMEGLGNPYTYEWDGTVLWLCTWNSLSEEIERACSCMKTLERLFVVDKLYHECFPSEKYPRLYECNEKGEKLSP